MKNDYKSKGKLNVNTSFNATAYKPNNGVMSRRDISPSPANKVGSILDKENIYSAAKHNYGIKPFEQYKMANLRQDNGDMRSASTRSNLSSNTSEHNEVSEPDQDTISTGAKWVWGDELRMNLFSPFLFREGEREREGVFEWMIL